MNSLKVIFDRDTWQEIFGSISKNKTRTCHYCDWCTVGNFYLRSHFLALQKVWITAFEREFENIAMNSMFVWAQRTSIPYDGFKIGRRIELKLSDIDYIKQRIPEVEFIAPRNARGVFGGSSPQVVRKNKSSNYNVYGDFPEYTKIATKKIYNGGRFINEEDIKYRRKVCVIGERTQTELFEKEENPIGQYIRIDNIYFQVIGVHKYVPGGGFESDGDIFIPFETYRKIYNSGDRVQWFTIAAYDDADVVAVEKDIKAALKRVHRVSPDDERAFGGFNLGAIFNKIVGFSKGMTLLSLIVGIATIIAGVIGIGNILLISVKERTKELGVRRALGATPGEVRNQIILESVFLTVIAGILGIILGALVLFGINAATQDLTDFPYTNPTVPIPFILGALFIMVFLGTLIGLIPAQRAVSIKPIDALREE
jgi:putative ABC transport system permease protein